MADDSRQKRENVGWSFGNSLCVRVSRSVAAFDHAFDVAVAQPTPEALDQLREATDQLLRAASRVLLEISRADARPH
jgi:hypothetical protein